MLCMSVPDCFGEEKLLLLEVFILNSILKAFVNGFANDNICKNTIQRLGARDKLFQRVYNIMLEAK